MELVDDLTLYNLLSRSNNKGGQGLSPVDINCHNNSNRFATLREVSKCFLNLYRDNNILA
jgi:hypothetical protein